MKNLNFILFLLLAFLSPLFGQKNNHSSNISNKIFISVKKDTPPSTTKGVEKPPYLEISNALFSDEDGNRKIDAEETTEIRFDLKNSGLGVGKDLVLSAKEKNGIIGLSFEVLKKINDLEIGQTVQIILPVMGLKNLKDGISSFEIEIIEPNGFGSDPLHIEIGTQAFRFPELKIVDYQVSCQNSTILVKKKAFDLDVLVQNLGQGIASNVNLSILAPQNILFISGNLSTSIGTLKPGEQKMINYSMVANNDYNQNTIPIEFKFSEKYNQYFENKTIPLTMNQQVSGEKLVVEGINSSIVPIEMASLSSDVDKNIPITNKKFDNKIALIIGNEDYSGNLNADINVTYARHDAEVFRNYVLNTLGFEEQNIIFLTDATAGKLNREIDRVAELIKRMGVSTELIFYYAGHGLPDENSKTPYLIPVDVNASNLSSAIPLNSIYRKFGETGAKKITIILDACFSGGARSHSLLAARSVKIKPKEEAFWGNTIVFSASSGEQSALPCDVQKHGLFTYFLLKKLKDSNGTVTYGELINYLKRTVAVDALRVNGKSQDPEVKVSPALQENWEKLTF